MTLLTEKGTFTKSTTSGANNQTVSLVNSSLTPKAVILWTTGHTTNDQFNDDSRFTYGFSDGTRHACQSFRQDESAESESYIFHDDATISLISLTAGTEVCLATTTTFAAGSFRVAWSANDTTAVPIHYMVIGGTDITNVNVVNATTVDTSTGNHSYNGTGTTFTPTFALTMTGASNLSGPNSLQTGFDLATISIGATDGTRQWVVSGRDETVGTSDCDMYINDAACLASHLSSDGSIVLLANFVSFNNAAGGGITVNHTSGAGSANQVVSFLFFRVASPSSFECGTFQQRSGTGTQDVSFVNSSLDPALVFLGGINTASNATVTANMYLSYGASDGTREGCSYFGNANNLGTYTAARVDSTTKVYRQATVAATATSSTINAEADMNDMATAGKFQLNWTTADTTLRRMAFWVLGEAAATTTVSETSIHKYNLAAYIAQTSIHKYNMIGNIAQTSIHKYHVLNNIAQTNIHKYNLLQNVLQSNIHKYNLAAYIAQTSIQKYNLLAYILQTNIHKYDILNFITPSTSIHKYNLFKNIAQTSIHKYNLLQNILQTSIHKYHMSGLIAALSIHKYNLSAYIAQTNIHKYNLLQNVLQASIHKYNLLANVLQSSIHKYNLLKNVLQTSIQKYNLFAYIAQTSIQKYNLLAYILQTSIHKYDIQVLGAVVQTSIQKYNLLANVVQNNIHKYNLLNIISQNSIHKYNILNTIAQTSIHKYNLLAQVLQTSIHKYDIITEAINVLQSSIHKYNISQFVTQSNLHKYNILQIIAQSSIHKYALLQNIVQNSIHKYNVRAFLAQQANSIHKYHMGGRVLLESIHKYKILPLVQEIFSTFMGGVPLRKQLKRIQYPVYHVTEMQRYERRRKLREVQPYVVIPAFKQNIHRTIAPFVITNPLKHTISVKFALKRAENVRFSGKIPVPIIIKSAKQRHQLHTAKAPFVMNQKAIRKYGNRLNRLSKVLKLLLLEENNPFKE